MIILRLALRELRGGIRDFRLFLGCLIIGTAVIAAVQYVSRHIETGIHTESKTLLGGDVELTQVNARATPEQIAFLKRFGHLSLTVNLRAMAIFGDNTVLVELRGVDDDYPLLGEAKLLSGSHLHTELASDAIIVEPSLLERIDAKVGDTILLGNTPFHIHDVLTKEPDSIAGPLTLGPRVMASIDTLERQQFLLPANLIRYHYHLLLTDSSQLESFKQEVAKTFSSASWIIKTANDNNRGIQDFISRLQLFMTLAGLSSLLIGGVGIMNASETYLSRKSETIAILKTLGAPGKIVFRVYALIVVIIAVIGSIIGAVLGAVIAIIALPYLADFVPVLDTRATMDAPAFLLSVGFGILTVCTFAVASLGRGIGVKPALLFRGLDPMRLRLPRPIIALTLLFASALIVLLITTASDIKIAGGFIGCAMVSLILFWLAARLTQSLAKRLHPKTPWARLAVANLHRPQSPTLSVLLSIGIGLTVLIALLLVEENFQREVNETIPELAPSLFLIDIQPVHKEEFLTFVRSYPYVSELAAQPMIRGRISKLNHLPVEKSTIASDAKWAIESDRGLTYATTPPAGSRVVKGSWWPENYHGKLLVSLDRKLAQGMGLTIGDTLTINILGEEMEAEISNLREINYTSFQINFAMIFSPGAIEKFPATYIATTRVDNEHHEMQLMRELAKQYPGISSVRIRDSIAQIKAIIDHIAFALHLCALVTLASGILVLATALSATLDKHIYDTVILKVLGAKRADILKMFLAEWVILALITSLIASVLGSTGAWLIITRMDWIHFQLVPHTILEAVGLALLFITGTGCIIQTRIFQVRASEVLRNE